ncbi:hypothetical protein [Streptomyces netropsis]|uniref:Uncharacterized protein n=1 Tax=Streptomyces netropsis TaxID=55404 RepID=A0A7W7LFK9_STRNE|nr:hypothetical protein [Streptomyces netropsis]MBB4889313.1 hypothetical protein [Streptomyces netropsis]GGR39253.1 hypothetical protein GCM10010219_50390 [Streptomyces netropsis]
MTALRHRLYRRLHPRQYRAGQLAEQRHQFLDTDSRPVPADYPRARNRATAARQDLTNQAAASLPGDAA